MKQERKDLILGLTILVILTVIVIGILRLVWNGLIALWAGIINLVETISTLDTALIIMLVSGAVTVLGIVVNSTISIVVKMLEHRNKARAELRERMEKPYEELVTTIYDIMNNDRMPNPKSDAEILEAMIAFSKKITLYGSNRVVKKYGIFRGSFNKVAHVGYMVQLEDVLFQIRKDLGMKKRGMKKGDIL